MSAVVIRAEDPASADEVGESLRKLFTQVRAAIDEGSHVVLAVRSADLLGHRGALTGAYVGAIVGMARAVAFEGVRPQWRINVVAAPAGRELSDLEAVACVGDDQMSGQVIVLGPELLGKVAP
ncbi:hypothetical protein [Microbispora sp. H10836]|uniref:hypothetical protein n=1 Tax=Microbispora sp. H10836 TaxID=2729106 RepID=UPI00147521BB|nr:hypothetical protein [Microbispora sp. H10836]